MLTPSWVDSFGFGVDSLTGSWFDTYMTTTTCTTGSEFFTTTCTCGLVRELHIASLPAVEAHDFLCSDCHADADRAVNGWTPENSVD